MARRGSIDGMDELIRMMEQLGKVPQRSVTKAARWGSRIALKAAKANAPVDKGMLRKGLKSIKEKRTKMGKAMFAIMPTSAMNDTFVKAVRNPTAMNKSKDPNRAYYPASQEYGFYNHWAGRDIQGLRYMRRAIDENDGAIKDKVLDVLGKDIDKALRGG